MDIKLIVFSFILTSLLFSLLYIPTKNSNPITILKPATTFIIPKDQNNPPYNATFAYLISGSSGDTMKLKRLMLALYHPVNYYLIHMDAAAPDDDHREIARFVSSNVVFAEVGNVWIVNKANLVTYRGPTMLSTTLHAMAMLLRAAKWDWFINLSASDYPLVTQDGMQETDVDFIADLIHAFSDLPKDLNFVQHTSRLGWKMNKRGKPIIVDPGLYSNNKSEIWWVIKQRSLPTAFKLYTGSAWMILSRSSAEYSIIGWDNLPRTLLLYYTNFVSSPEGYFQTLLCNSEELKKKTVVVNHDLQFITWDNPPKQHPRSLGLKDYRKMIRSNRPFARKFSNNDPVLNKIDRHLLNRGGSSHFALGGWCFESENNTCKCAKMKGENYGVLRPGTGSRRLRILLNKLLSARKFSKKWCT